ncbi:Signal recognition particle subunit SRP68 [Amphibalanus amphitrite]|uniref:Signal recognition particle subunit SRP68 n=1 Tax=Amphibalanus amphitrite TaxID=1232801 RepID=A0A6A4VK64_AMPAM|nr:Signal recognition particle subunit SRP68 [Amphibalanus amphitrite]
MGVEEEPMQVEDAEDLEESDEEEVKTEEPQVFTLKVLKVIKEAQAKHGLRHGDYQRYRSYCSRRIRRLRKYLHFVQGNKKNFRRKDVTEDVLKDEKYLYIPLMTVERAWSYAMQLKQEANTEHRKKYHLASRLRKAAQQVELFQKLTDESARCDARTKLEVQAYAADIRGTLAFELRRWNEAIEHYTQARTIYEKLASALNEEEAAVYKTRAEELVPSLRFCAYSVGDEVLCLCSDRFCAYSVGDKAAGEDIMKMRPGHNDMLDTLIAETRARQAEALSEVTWRGRTVGVQHEKVRSFLLSVQEFESAVQQAEDKLDLYETQLMDCKDAVNVVKEELRQDPAYKQYQPGGDAPVGPMHYLLTYLSFIRLNTTVQRNLIIIENTEARRKEKAKGVDGRRARIQDVIRLYEIILQNLQEIPQLAGLEGDLEIRSSVQAQISAYKGFRCFYVAETYAGHEKWPEALALYSRVENYCQNSLQSELEPDLKSRVERLLTEVEGRKYAVHARSILATEDLVEKTQQLNVSDLKAQLSASALGAAVSCSSSSSSFDVVEQIRRPPLVNKPLSDRLDEYVDAPEAADRICQMPPAMQPVPCKPLFFDLALNHLQFPDVSAEMGARAAAAAPAAGQTGGQAAAQPGGLTGFVKGLWGWGGK